MPLISPLMPVPRNARLCNEINMHTTERNVNAHNATQNIPTQD